MRRDNVAGSVDRCHFVAEEFLHIAARGRRALITNPKKDSKERNSYSGITPHRTSPNALLHSFDTYMDMHIYIPMKHRKPAKPPDPALLFKALSDPTRLRLLNLLAGGEICVCDLHDTLGVEQPKVSRHLARMKRAGLVDTRREGKWMHYRWARHGDPLVRHVLKGLRAWMNKESHMKLERERLRKVCCWNDTARERRRRTS